MAEIKVDLSAAENLAVDLSYRYEDDHEQALTKDQYLTFLIADEEYGLSLIHI